MATKKLDLTPVVHSIYDTYRDLLQDCDGENRTQMAEYVIDRLEGDAGIYIEKLIDQFGYNKVLRTVAEVF